jgi:hypothetical protein
MLQKNQPITQTKVLRLYKPHEVQKQLHVFDARFRVGVWGRQSGKSTWCLNEILRRAWEKPGTTYWFIAPTYSQAKVQYRRLVGMLWNCKGILLKKNQTELRIKLANMSSILFVSGNEIDNLRGETLHGSVIDEVRDQSPELWPMVIRPMLSTTRGWCAFVSTPNGFDAFYDLYDRAKNDTTGRWAAIQAPSTANPLFSQEEFELARQDMSEPQFAQEILADFRDLTAGKAYFAFGPHNILPHTPFKTSDLEQIVSDRLPVVVTMDFNLHPMAWELGQTDGNRWYWFDEIFLENSNTQEATKALIEKLRVLKARGLLRSSPEIVICGDSAGKAGQRAAAGQSDYDIVLGMLKAAGFTYDNAVPEANPIVKDRVNNTNAKLKSASGEVFMWFHPSMVKAQRDFQRTVWKAAGVLEKTKDPMLTHSSDGIGYAVTELTPIKSINDVGTLQVIIR